MFDHISIKVSDFEKSLKFYEAALGPIGYQATLVSDQSGKSAGFGLGKALRLWISEGVIPNGNMHIAFSTDDHKSVDAFYAAAIGAGGRDNGSPGLRPHYHEAYYACFVLDPDGNNIEAVSHFPGKAEDQFPAE